MASLTVVPPGCPLTRRQLEVIQEGYHGLSYSQTAAKLQIEVSTVRTHWHGAYVQLQAKSRGEIFAICIRERWLAKDDTAASLVVIFRDRPEPLGLTRVQRVYLDEFQALLNNHRDPDEVRCEAAASLMLPRERPRPGNNLDGFYRFLLPVVCGSVAYGPTSPIALRRRSLSRAVADVPSAAARPGSSTL